jgi:hypothetical protein
VGRRLDLPCCLSWCLVNRRVVWTVYLWELGQKLGVLALVVVGFEEAVDSRTPAKSRQWPKRTATERVNACKRIMQWLSGRHKAETRYATCQKGDKGASLQGWSKEAISDYVLKGAEAVVFMTHKSRQKSAQKNPLGGAVTGEGKKGQKETVSVRSS